jgi:hypothetical protein
VVAFRRLDHCWELGGILAPVELARINDDTADGGSMTADPFGGAVDNNVRAMVDGTDVEASRSERVVNL